MKGYIYRVTNSENRKIYIGQTIQEPNKRWSAHKYAAKIDKYKGNYFHSAIRKYGKENFLFEVIEEFSDPTSEGLNKVLNWFEIFYIMIFKSNDRELGYNLTKGGDGVKEFKKTAEQIEKTASKLRGRTLSEAHKKQIGENKSKAVNQLTKNGDYIASFKSMKEAEEITTVSFKNISKCCRGRSKTAGGFKWEYKL